MFSCEFLEIFKNSFFHRTPLVADSEKLKTEAVVWRCTVKKAFLEILLNSQENLCQSLFFHSLRNATLLKQSIWHRPYPVNFANIFLRTPFYRTHPVAAPVKPCNFTNTRLRNGSFFVNVLKLFGTYFDVLLEFSKISQKYCRKKFAKYLSADGCFLKTNTINFDDNDDATCFLILGRLLLLGSSWNEFSLEVLERFICETAPPFYVD